MRVTKSWSRYAERLKMRNGPRLRLKTRSGQNSLVWWKRKPLHHWNPSNRSRSKLEYTYFNPFFQRAMRIWNTVPSSTAPTTIQRTPTRWATRDYQRTSSVTQMIKDLNWRTLEQRRIDSQLTLMYKITYDLVAIPAAEYLIPNTRQSRHNHQLNYRQIPTLKDYYKYTFFPRTIVHWSWWMIVVSAFCQ